VIGRLQRAVARRWGRVQSRRLAAEFVRRPPAPTTRVGTDYGGWHCLTDRLRSGEVAVCVGAGEDVSFDVALNARYGLEILCIDPTPRAVRHVEGLLAAARRGEAYPIGDGPACYELAGFEPARFHLVACALWSADTDLELYLPQDERHVSLSAVNLQRTSQTVRVRAARLASVLAERRIGDVALLKMDVEGAEYVVLEDLLAGAIRPRQLLVEFEDFNRPSRLRFTAPVRRLLGRLSAAGYELRHVDGANLLFDR
jgi:FkbM family methyltransferase